MSATGLRTVSALVIVVASVVFSHRLPHPVLRYRLTRTHDGRPLDHSNQRPVLVELTATCDGDLKLDIEAPFYNTPVPLHDRCHECPAAQIQGWPLEDVEIFLANDAGHYYQLLVSPSNLYLNFLFDGIRNRVRSALPVNVEVDNPCVTEEGVNECENRVWTASAVIPKEYLPYQVSKFNAFSIHGSKWGEEEPEESSFVYEALYPTQKEGEKADFHVVDGFEPIDLSKVGVKIAASEQEASSIWQDALNPDTSEPELTYTIENTIDCEKPIVSDKYSAHVTLRKHRADSRVVAEVEVREDPRVRPVIDPLLQRSGPNAQLKPDSESFWINLQSKKGNGLRVGINPYGAYRLFLHNNGEEISLDNELKLEGVACQLINMPSEANVWKCRFEVPWHYLPDLLKDSSLQAIHVHKPLISGEPEPKSEASHDFELVGASCPGFDKDEWDWQGCLFDHKTIYDPLPDKRVSDLWQHIMPKEEQQVQEPEKHEETEQQ